MQRMNYAIFKTALLAGGLCALAACGGDDDDAQPSIDGGAMDASTTTDGGDAGTPGPKEFLVGTLVTSVDTGQSNAYAKFLPNVELGGATVSLDGTREFGGPSDLWVIGESVYVAKGGSLRVTRYERDANQMLVERGSVGFENYGPPDGTAFWNHVFVSPTKAYLANGPDEIIVWNPTTMLVEGTIEIPDIGPRNGRKARASYADRSNKVVDGKLYRTLHWTTEDYATRDAQSLVIVIDTATNKWEKSIPVNCGGLDYGTVTDDGRLFFSNWTGSVGSRLILNDQPTCFAEIDPKTNTVVATANFADVTNGREGAALRYIGDGKLGFAVVDPAKLGDTTGQTTNGVVSKPIFQFWSYDLKSHQAAVIEGIDHNSGAVYEDNVQGSYWALIPGENYASTVVYKLEGGKAIRAFAMTGWVLRLFGYPN